MILFHRSCLTEDDGSGGESSGRLQVRSLRRYFEQPRRMLWRADEEALREYSRP